MHVVCGRYSFLFRVLRSSFCFMFFKSVGNPLLFLADTHIMFLLFFNLFSWVLFKRSVLFKTVRLFLVFIDPIYVGFVII